MKQAVYKVLKIHIDKKKKIIERKIEEKLFERKKIILTEYCISEIDIKICKIVGKKYGLKLIEEQIEGYFGDCYTEFYFEGRGEW